MLGHMDAWWCMAGPPGLGQMGPPNLRAFLLSHKALLGVCVCVGVPSAQERAGNLFSLLNVSSVTCKGF